MSKIERYILYLLFLSVFNSCNNSTKKREIAKCYSDEKSNSQNLKIKLNAYEHKIEKILKKKLTVLKESRLKSLLNENYEGSNISKDGILLKFQFLLSSKGKVIDTVILCSNTSESINKTIMNSVLELNFGPVPKDLLEKGPIFGIIIPYSSLF